MKEDGVDIWRRVLGNPTPNFIRFCWTVTVCDSLKVKVQLPGYKKPQSLRYDELRPRQQYEYLVGQYIPRVVQPCVDAYWFEFELNAKGNVHAHGLVLIYDKPVRCDYWLADIRAQCRQIPFMNRMGVKGKWSNHIVINDREDAWVEYIQKDNHKQLFPSMFNMLAPPVAE